MIPEKYRNYMFNENDFLPQDYHVDDPEKLKYLKIAAAMISDDINVLGNPKKIQENDPDLWLLDRLLSNIRKEEIFIPQNVSYLRGISWACFAMCVPCLFVAVYGSQTFLFIMVAAAFMGLILRVVKNVIEAAVLIKEENDYTV
jgi:hypothetical protein